MRKILIPYLLAGDGHILTAQSIAYYLSVKKPNWKIRFLEPADEFNDKKLDTSYRRAWKIALTKPSLSKLPFALFGKIFPSVSLALNKSSIKDAIPKAADVLRQFKPDAIMATHWSCGHIFQAARKEAGCDIPLLYVRNELGGAVKVQDCGADYLFVTSEDAKNDFIKIGFPEEKLIRVNFLVNPKCIEDRMSKEEARKKCNIPQDAFTILLTIGGEGVGLRFTPEFIDTFLDETKKKNVKSRLIVVTGRNIQLYERLTSRYPIPEIVALGYREDMHVLKAASDILAGKCGAIYSMEAVMMHKPFIITLVGAPNENFNKEFIVKNGYGWYTPKPSDFASLLKDILNDPALIEEKVKASSKVPLRNGAEDIAETLINILS